MSSNQPCLLFRGDTGLDPVAWIRGSSYSLDIHGDQGVEFNNLTFVEGPTSHIYTSKLTVNNKITLRPEGSTSNIEYYGQNNQVTNETGDTIDIQLPILNRSINTDRSTLVVTGSIRYDDKLYELGSSNYRIIDKPIVLNNSKEINVAYIGINANSINVNYRNPGNQASFEFISTFAEQNDLNTLSSISVKETKDILSNQITGTTTAKYIENRPCNVTRFFNLRTANIRPYNNRLYFDKGSVSESSLTREPEPTNVTMNIRNGRVNMGNLECNNLSCHSIILSDGHIEGQCLVIRDNRLVIQSIVSKRSIELSKDSIYINGNLVFNNEKVTLNGKINMFIGSVKLTRV